MQKRRRWVSVVTAERSDLSQIQRVGLITVYSQYQAVAIWTAVSSTATRDGIAVLRTRDSDRSHESCALVNVCGLSSLSANRCVHCQTAP